MEGDLLDCFNLYVKTLISEQHHSLVCCSGMDCPRVKKAFWALSMYAFVSPCSWLLVWWFKFFLPWLPCYGRLLTKIIYLLNVFLSQYYITVTETKLVQCPEFLFYKNFKSFNMIKNYFSASYLGSKLVL